LLIKTKHVRQLVLIQQSQGSAFLGQEHAVIVVEHMLISQASNRHRFRQLVLVCNIVDNSHKIA